MNTLTLRLACGSLAIGMLLAVLAEARHHHLPEQFFEARSAAAVVTISDTAPSTQAASFAYFASDSNPRVGGHT